MDEVGLDGRVGCAVDLEYGGREREGQGGKICRRDMRGLVGRFVRVYQRPKLVASTDSNL